MKTGAITADLEPGAWSGGDTAEFEAEATKLSFEEFDFVLESGDVIDTPGGRIRFDRAVRDSRGMWTLRHEREDGRVTGHGPSWAAMKLRKGEWELVEWGDS